MPCLDPSCTGDSESGRREEGNIGIIAEFRSGWSSNKFSILEDCGITKHCALSCTQCQVGHYILESLALHLRGDISLVHWEALVHKLSQSAFDCQVGQTSQILKFPYREPVGRPGSWSQLLCCVASQEVYGTECALTKY